MSLDPTDQSAAGETAMQNTTASDAINHDDLHYYNPEIISRYIQFYKGNNDETKPNNNTNSSAQDDSAPPLKKKPKRKSKKQISPKVLEYRRKIQFCCKDNDLARALRVFRTALLLGGTRSNNISVDDDGPKKDDDDPQQQIMVRLEPQTFYNLLNLCDGSFGGGGGGDIGRVVHVGTPKTTSRSRRDDGSEKSTSVTEALNDNSSTTNKDGSRDDNNNDNNKNITLQQRLHHAKQIHTLLTSLNIPCIEPAFTALIRLAVRVGDYELAQQYLKEAEGTQQCKVKLRMYSSLLRGYCGDLSGEKLGDDATGGSGSGAVIPTREGLIQALKVWKRMYENSGGISDGHPRFHESKQTDSNNSSTTQNDQQKREQLLFGEGVSPKISLSEYEYAALLKCATALNDVKVAERVLSDIAESVMVPGLSTMEVMLDWFRSDRRTDNNTSETTATSSSALDHVTLPPREGEGLSVGPITNDTGRGWNIYRDCTIDPSTGLLQLTHPEEEVPTTSESSSNSKQTMMIEYRLKPVELTQQAWKAMREMNSSIVLEGTVEGNISAFQGGGKGKKRPRGSDVISKLHDGNSKQGSTAQHGNKYNNGKKKDPNWRINHWKEFETFIENHPTYNIVIDGANVGYKNQSYRLGSNAPRHVDYKQIDGLIRHLLELQSNEGHHIILFMHERHFTQRLLPQWAYPIIQMWDGDEAPYDKLTVYRTPQGLNDDWYWMHAALINGGRDDKPPVLAITNDEMRDHHFQMTAQGYFLRWKERHQVHFDFGEWNRELKRNDVLLEYPSIYSRRIQRVNGEESATGKVVAGADAIVIPLPKKGDENRFVDGVHVADAGIPQEETYVVVQRVTS